jgi:hypothetical protein
MQWAKNVKGARAVTRSKRRNVTGWRSSHSDKAALDLIVALCVRKCNMS